jgi:hypothetical protein
LLDTIVSIKISELFENKISGLKRSLRVVNHRYLLKPDDIHASNLKV